MSSAGDDPVFDGVTGLKCESFIQAIRRRSFSEGKTKDDEWTAHFASTSFDGPALRWFESLDDATQDSWKLLRLAMLERWPATQATDGTSTRSVPTPASSTPSRATVPTPAAAPPSSLAASLASLNLGHSVKRGRIRVIRDTGEYYGHVSHNRNVHGLYQTTQNIADALIVEFTPSHKPQNMQSASLNSRGEWLGITWGTTVDLPTLQTGLQNGLTYWGAIATMTQSQNGISSRSTSTLYSGPSRSAIWSVLIDGSIILTWEGQSRNQNSLDIAVHTAGGYYGTIQVISNFEVFMSHHQDPGWCKARFVFEDIQ